MFDIGWSELLVIGVVALIAIGPKELPTVLRTVGHWMGKVRRMASEFQGQFQEAMREAELADVKKQFEDAAASTTDFGKFDPLADTQKSLENLTSDTPVQAEPNTPTPLPEAPVPVPEVKIEVPLPEPPAPVTSADFAPAAEPQPAPEPKKAESA